MLKPLRSLFRRAVSGQAALHDLARIVAHHRIQSSPGFREAARFCLERLRDAGISADILFFPGDGVTSYWGHPVPQEWSAQAATLRLIAPEKQARTLADYREEKISLIQRSLATPADGLEADLVVLEDGEEEAEYEGLDLAGKVVLTRGDLDRVRELAVGRHGAVGILFDGMRDAPPVRPLMGLPEARQYTSFWWETAGSELPSRCFGFVLSPAQGEWLRRLVRAQAREGRSVRVHAAVDASTYAGHMELVEGFIPGETPEEVWLVAHLCHPQPSANDNASGAATLLEVARAIARLIEAGELPQPRRGLRFLLVPEMTGTFAYLATHEERIPHVVAALNLDMVGEDQSQCGSTLQLTGAPLSAASLSDDLLALIFEAVAEEGAGFMGAGSYALFRWAEAPFSAGSDHYILTDPMVGIPCPMLLQWPDRFYHTTADTLDKVDPQMLERVGVAAGIYLWWLATAGPREARWLGQALLTRAEARLGRMGQQWLDGLLGQDPAPSPEDLGRALERLRRQLNLLLEQRQASLGLLERLAGEEIPAAADWRELLRQAGRRTLERAEAAVVDLFDLETVPPAPPSSPDPWEERAARIVPRRLVRGPLPDRARRSRLSQPDREAFRTMMKEHRYGLAAVLAPYWTDGRRTLLEIADRVEAECGQRQVEMLVRYYQVLETMELMELERQEGESS